ncbi:hypothetical protein TRFO_03530 [Tritrichomonas foetus]|uniref:BRCT domain-containing protein n=1 Tax=Tritrichomonas foetus TaxID=1144522 RepID=A0A1J4KPQ4_9EUKA|nr:hypothetical protein TRFO_03530 [Tritrichomonas foetus]|eukprot:OHT13090.1 hypothetical protein TRFO_03530 [Tritrichomonas foetus]
MKKKKLKAVNELHSSRYYQKYFFSRSNSHFPFFSHMRFPTFYLSPSITTNLDDVRHLISRLSFKMTEVFSPTPDSLIIASIDEVIDSFESQKYEISDLCLREMINMQIPEFPIRNDVRQRISLCLSPLWASCVGYPTDDIIEINRKILLLGGTFTRGFSENVTIVISKTNVSPKAIEARRNGLPIVGKEWLDACFSAVSRVPLFDFILPPFRGVTFTSSDLPPKLHHELKNRVVKEGGTWTDVFNDDVTYLVAESLTNTKKIGIALAQSVLIVKPDYIFDPSRFEAINWWALTDTKSLLFRGMVFSVQKKCAHVDAITDTIIAHSGTLGNTSTHVIVKHGFKLEAQPTTTIISKQFNNTPNQQDLHQGNWDVHHNVNGNVKNEHDGGKSEQINDRKGKRNSRSMNHNFNPNNIVFVTPEWFWACVESKTLLNTNLSPLYSPLPFSAPIEGITNVTFFLSNLGDEQRKTTACLIREAGGIPIFRLTENVKFIIAEEYNNDLFKLEMKRKASVVSPNFVLMALKTGTIPQVNQFQVEGRVKKDMMKKICKFICSKSNLQVQPQIQEAPEVPVDLERTDLETFTQELTSTPNEVAIEVKYDSQPCTQNQNLIQTNNEEDPFLTALQSGTQQQEREY